MNAAPTAPTYNIQCHPTEYPLNLPGCIAALALIPVPAVSPEEPGTPERPVLRLPLSASAYRLPSLFATSTCVIRVDVSRERDMISPLALTTPAIDASEMIFHVWPMVRTAAELVLQRCLRDQGQRGLAVAQSWIRARDVKLDVQVLPREEVEGQRVPWGLDTEKYKIYERPLRYGRGGPGGSA